MEKGNVIPTCDSVEIKELQYISPKKFYLLFKRFSDILISVLGLIVLIVPFLIISLIIMIDSPGAPFYVQKRVGKNGKVFNFYKFRTMVKKADNMIESLLHQNEMDGPVFKIKDDPRITRVGKFLRKSSIDELPQLLNVIKGDMSLVGPRPPLPREVEKYTDYQRQRLNVTPGITCFWQVQPKRNSILFDDWVELDLKYIREQGFLTDVILIFKTIRAVCNLEGE